MSNDEQAGARRTVSPGAARLRARATAAARVWQGWTGKTAARLETMRSCASPMARTALPRSRARLRVQERLEGAQRLARSRSFEVELATGAVEASLPMFELLGLLPRQGQGWQSYARFLDAQDRDPLERTLRRCIEQDRAAAFDARVFRADGTPRVLRCRLVARRDVDGEPITLEGSVQDVTEGRRATTSTGPSRRRPLARAGSRTSSPPTCTADTLRPTAP
jgi:PAS domain-containing protein